jgi:hypothetical protein
MAFDSLRLSNGREEDMSTVWIRMIILGITACVALSGVGIAQPAATQPKGEAVIGAIQVTATVTKIDLATREVSLKTNDGRELTFVVDPAVKNLPQVKPGDQVEATYTEAIAYEVKKGGAAGVTSAAAGATAKPGGKPAGAVGQQITLTVSVAAIDPKVPSVTFKGPGGNTRTVRVQRPEKLQGVSVGDTVDITYTEALAVKVERAPKK